MNNSNVPDPDNTLHARLSILLLLTGTLLVLILWYRILVPFVPVFSWALALAIVFYPFFSWLGRRIANENVSAAITVAAVALLIIGPFSFIFRALTVAASENAKLLTTILQGDSITKFIQAKPKLRSLYRWLNTNFDLQGGSQEMLTSLQQNVPTFLSSSLLSIVQLFLVFFTIFFLLRDRIVVLYTLRNLIPLSRKETDKIFAKLHDTIYATLYGTLTVAIVQGTLGGIMFWLLGIPSPLLWGAVMAGLALVPYLGTFIVWAPAAAFLALQGDWTNALILTAWGGLVIALIDNLLYPVLVGKKLRFHTVPTFFFILGGILFFGTSGIVLGPIALALGYGLIEIWKTRLAREDIKVQEAQAAS